jgi:putative transposase
MRNSTTISERRACWLVGLSRTVLSYGTKPDPEAAVLRDRLTDLAATRRRFGYRRLHALLRREGISVNHKRLYRIYREAGLSVRRRRRRRGVAALRQPLTLPTAPNQVWSMDFVMDALDSGRRLKCLTIVDDFTKESIDIVVDHSIPGLYCHPCARPGHRLPRLPARDSDRSRPRIHRPRTGPVGLSSWCRAHADRTREAHAKRLH